MKIIKKLLISILVVASLSTTAQMQTYHIKKDNHYCEETRFKTTSTSQTIEFILPTSALYDPDSVIPGWNKLWGFSYGLFNHNNSLRLAWRSDGEKFYVGFYAYVNSQRIAYQIGTAIYPGELHTATICYYNKEFKIILDGNSYTCSQPNKPGWLNLQQYPYFGGESPATHDIELLIRKL